MQISIGFSTNPKSWISRAIRWFTKSQYSHAFLVVTDVPGLGEFIVQADTGGVEVTSFHRFDFEKNPMLKQIVPHADLAPALRECMNLLNDSYDFAGLFGMVWVKLWWIIFKKRLKNVFHIDRKAFFCSAFVTKVLQTAKWPGADQLVPEETDPQQLADFLDAHPA